MILLAGAAWAHGVGFETTAVSVLPDDPSELWAAMEDWGVVRSTDGGATWTWTCEEAIGTSRVYDVLAVGPGEAVAGTADGLVRMGEAIEPVAGLPEGAFVPVLARRDEGWLALAIGAEEGGVWTCDDAGCVATDLVAPGLFPKSAVTDGDTSWVTTVDEATLAAALSRSEDGATWVPVAAWPDGDLDPTVLHADGDTLLVWVRPRVTGPSAQLLRSDDGGATFAEVLALGTWTDDAPGLVAVGGRVVVGSAVGARTWASDDDGRTWTEVSLDAPSVRCGETLGDRAWACAEHVNDGFDLSVSDDGVWWTPVACLEEAEPAEACLDRAEAWDAAAATGGGRCGVEVGPAAEETRGCGCGGTDAAWLLVGGVLGRRRRALSPTS